MSESHRFIPGYAHLVSFAVVEWIDVFTRRKYAEFLIKNLQYCQKNKGLRLHEFVIMPNHVHLIASVDEGLHLGDIIRDFKTYTSKELFKMIAGDPNESRKEWMLKIFREAGAKNNYNVHHQFWQQSNKPIVLDTPEKYDRCAVYVRENPLHAGLVEDETAYKWSSANERLGFKLDD